MGSLMGKRSQDLNSMGDAVNVSGTLEVSLYPKGDKGDSGVAATIEIGAVEMGDYPEIINVGTPQNAILNFTVPFCTQEYVDNKIAEIVNETIPVIDENEY